MRIPLYQVDAFADRPFTGNPAAVCVLERWLPDETLQHIAEENNLSETAFLVPTDDAFSLRWFTPLAEVPLCGHATLAAAHVLFERRGVAGDRIAFETLSGRLTVERGADRLVLDLPARPAVPCEAPAALVALLGAPPLEVLSTERTLVAVLKNEQAVRGVVPEAAAILALGRPYLSVTAPGAGCDFVSRFFAPGVGVLEDAVTGSAHCTLVPYWATRLGRNTLHARQVSERGGDLWCESRGARVGVGGRAVLVLEGHLLL